MSPVFNTHSAYAYGSSSSNLHTVSWVGSGFTPSPTAAPYPAYSASSFFIPNTVNTGSFAFPTDQKTELENVKQLLLDMQGRLTTLEKMYEETKLKLKEKEAEDRELAGRKRVLDL